MSSLHNDIEFIPAYQVKELHDLIVKIRTNVRKIDDDMDNLNNLFHFIKGDGIRLPEYITVK